MHCPQCGKQTRVTEKRGPFRERRCTNLACGLKFTTREHVIPRQEESFCARTRAIKIGGAKLAKDGGKRSPSTGEAPADGAAEIAERRKDLCKRCDGESV